MLTEDTQDTVRFHMDNTVGGGMTCFEEMAWEDVKVSQFDIPQQAITGASDEKVVVNGDHGVNALGVAFQFFRVIFPFAVLERWQKGTS